MVEAFVTGTGTVYTIHDVVQYDIVESMRRVTADDAARGGQLELTFHERSCCFSFKTPSSDLRAGMTGSISFGPDSYEASILRVTNVDTGIQAVAAGKRLMRVTPSPPPA
jgi:hypothetical protein